MNLAPYLTFVNPFAFEHSVLYVLQQLRLLLIGIASFVMLIITMSQ